MGFSSAGVLWLIVRRTVAQRWPRMLATLAACTLSVGLLAGSLQFAFQVQAALAGSKASEYAKADVLVQPASGGSIEASTLSRLMTVPGVSSAAGDTSVPAEIVGGDGHVVLGPAGAGTVLRPWLEPPGLSAYRLVSGRAPAAVDEVVVDRHIAGAGRLAAGSTTVLLLPDRIRTVHVVGVSTVDGADTAAEGDIVLTAAAAMAEAAGLPAGSWQQVLVRGDGRTPPEQLRQRVAGALGPTVTVSAGGDVRARQIAAVEGRGTAIAGNLSMLALIGIFVGLFVIASAFGTLVRQRSRELAMLRVVGVTPRQVRVLVRLEALAIGLLSGFAGILLGLLLARLFAWQLGDALDVSGVPPQLDTAYFVIPLGASLVVTWLATVRAAWWASRIPPVQALAQSSSAERIRYRGRIIGVLVLLGLAAGMLAGAFSARRDLPGAQGVSSAGAGVVVAALITISALAVLMPLLAHRLGWLVGSVGAAVRRDVGVIARGFVTGNPRRVASAASMLMLTVALSTVAWMLITSVRAGTAAQGVQQLRADRVVTVATGTGLPDEITGRVAQLPAVRTAAALRQAKAPVIAPIPPPKVRGRPAIAAPLTVTGTQPASLSTLVDLGSASARIGVLQEGEVAIGDELASAYGWPTGTRLVLRGSHGPVQLTVVAVYPQRADTFVGDAIVTAATLRQLDPATFTRAVLVQRAAGIGDAELTRQLTQALHDTPDARVLDRAGFAQLAAAAVLFGVGLLYLFIGSAVLTALFGVATTLSLAVFERTREFGMLRAVGAEDGQVRAIVRTEAATVVVLGISLGVGTGVTTVAMTRLVTGSDLISARLPVPALLVIAAAAIAVTALASLLPARRAARVPVLEATRAE